MTRVLLPPDVADAARGGEEFELDAGNGKKLTRVLRLTPGETFIAFDGLGHEWDCVLAAVGEDAALRKGRGVMARLLDEREAISQVLLHLSVAQAVPKGDKMEWVLQKGTEMGVSEFWPFDAERSVTRLLVDEAPERATVRAERWRRIVAHAAGQCGRSDLPIVHAVADLATAVDYGTSGSRCFMLDEDEAAEPLRQALLRDPLQGSAESPPRVMLLVGPEGGWAAREREWAGRYGVEAVGLGRRTLRTETAALVAVALLQWEAGGFD